MQSKILKNNWEASEKHMSSQHKTFCSTIAGHPPKSYSEAHTVSDIANGLCESIKNVHTYRLSLHEEIKDILKRHISPLDIKAMPDNWTLTREED